MKIIPYLGFLIVICFGNCQTETSNTQSPLCVLATTLSAGEAHQKGIALYESAADTTYSIRQQLADSAICYFKHELQLLQQQFGRNHWRTHKARLNIAVIYQHDLYNLVTAQQYYETALFDSQTDTTQMSANAPLLEAEILYNIGVITERLGEYDLGLAHAIRADSLFKSKPMRKTDSINYLNNLLNWADIEMALKAPIAIQHFKEVEALTQKILKHLPNSIERGDYESILLAAQLNRGIAHRLMQALKAAETDLLKAQKLCIEREDSANVRIELAKLYLDKKQYPLAENYALQSLQLRSDYPKGHIIFAEIYTVLGQIYLKINQLDKAKKAFESAIDQKLGNLSLPSVWQIEAASQLADLQSKTDIEGAAKTYQTISDALYQRKSFFKTDAAKLNLTQQARAIFSKSISLNCQLHEKKREMMYLNRILTDMERSKAVLMSEMIQDSRIQYEGVPNEIRQTERLLRLKVAQAERNLNNDAIDQHNKDFSKSYQDLQTFIQTSEAKYPKYFNFKHQKPQNYEVSEVQNSLPNETGLIHYYLSDNVLHILAIDKSNVKPYELPLTAQFDTAFNCYQRIIAQSKWDWKQNANFSQASYELYQDLLEKPLSDFGNTCKTLITIPDEKLASLSFAALFTAPKMLGEAHDEPYLIQKYAINMAYTISDCGFRISDYQSFRNPKSEIHNPKFVYAGFSHDFKNLSPQHLEAKVLETLPNSKNHIEKVHQKFVSQGKTYMNDTMTVEAFKKNAPKSRITEIISHAGFDERDTRRSVIAFPAGDSLNWFDINTIYNMDWSQNQLIALIACETGKGLPVRGETVISMSYAFGYAGSRRRISALWSIPHKHSMQLMDIFFDHLNKKEMPAIALQKAQIQFLKSGESAEQQTPNLWAGLTLSGNIASISE